MRGLYFCTKFLSQMHYIIMVLDIVLWFAYTNFRKVNDKIY